MAKRIHTKKGKSKKSGPSSKDSKVKPAFPTLESALKSIVGKNGVKILGSLCEQALILSVLGDKSTEYDRDWKVFQKHSRKYKRHVENIADLIKYKLIKFIE